MHLCEDGQEFPLGCASLKHRVNLFYILPYFKYFDNFFLPPPFLLLTLLFPSLPVPPVSSLSLSPLSPLSLLILPPLSFFLFSTLYTHSTPYSPFLYYFLLSSPPFIALFPPLSFSLLSSHPHLSSPGPTFPSLQLLLPLPSVPPFSSPLTFSFSSSSIPFLLSPFLSLSPFSLNI